jgi:anaerobic dimethyl sulfoxide reductase subunit A
MMEDYEMRYYNNIDDSVTLSNSGKLVTKNTTSVQEDKGRYVYPIAMYIPIVEGRHHDETNEPHPDPMELNGEYPLSFHTWHIIYRSHSTFNSSPYTNEVKYYKRDSKGKPAHLKRNLTSVEGNAAPSVWTDEVYETVWLNPVTAASNGITEGMPIICESPRGKIKVSAHLSKRIRQGVVMIGQGSWYNPDNNGAGGAIDKNVIDIGGNANTLFSLRPSRIGQGMTLASDCRIKIYPA